MLSSGSNSSTFHNFWGPSDRSTVFSALRRGGSAQLINPKVVHVQQKSTGLEILEALEISKQRGNASKQYCWWFKNPKANHLEWLSFPINNGDNHHPWWCRILSINNIICTVIMHHVLKKENLSRESLQAFFMGVKVYNVPVLLPSRPGTNPVKMCHPPKKLFLFLANNHLQNR